MVRGDHASIDVSYRDGGSARLTGHCLGYDISQRILQRDGAVARLTVTIYGVGIVRGRDA